MTIMLTESCGCGWVTYRLLVELIAVQYCHRRHRQKRGEATYALKRQRAVFGDRT